MLQPCSHLLQKGSPLGPIVCDVFFCVLSLSHMVSWVRCEFDCMDSCSLPSSFYIMHKYAKFHQSVQCR